MNIKQIITDYIMKSILETQGDMVVRGAAIPEKLVAVAVGQVLKSGGVGAVPAWGVPQIANMNMAIGNYIQAVTGDQVISGLGFPPHLVFFLANDTTTSNKNFSIGIDNGTILIGLWFQDSLLTVHTGETFSIYIRRDGTHFITGQISALGGDGFTVSHALMDTCSATVRWFAIG